MLCVCPEFNRSEIDPSKIYALFTFVILLINIFLFVSSLLSLNGVLFHGVCKPGLNNEEHNIDIEAQKVTLDWSYNTQRLSTDQAIVTQHLSTDRKMHYNDSSEHIKNKGVGDVKHKIWIYQLS